MITIQRLYKVIVTEYPEDRDEGYEPGWEPEGWADFAAEHLTPGQQFHWPAEGKVYRSRSAARNALARFERWGAVGFLAEAEPEWTPVALANQRREDARRLARVARLQEQIDGILATVTR